MFLSVKLQLLVDVVMPQSITMSDYSAYMRLKTLTESSVVYSNIMHEFRYGLRLIGFLELYSGFLPVRRSQNVLDTEYFEGQQCVTYW